jgi:hypothetical protein
MRRGLLSVALGAFGLLGLLAVPAEGATPLVRHTVPGIGFSIGVPSSWKAVDYRQVATSGVIDRLVKENPNLAAVLRAIQDPKSGVRFFAVDPRTTNGFATNLNLVVEKVPRGFSATSYADAAMAQLLAVPNVIRPVRRQTVRLPAGASVRLRYGINFTIGGRSIAVAITQYALVRGTRAFVVTYTTLPSQAAKLSPLFEASARSIRLG